jgi:photosystem II stability/assembly factor-like uncharacterized protein
MGKNFDSILEQPVHYRTNDVDVDLQGNLYVATDRGVLKSINSGATWVERNYGLTMISIESLAEDGDANIFAGTKGHGVFKSTNGTNTWESVRQGVEPPEMIKGIIVNPAGAIFIGAFNADPLREGGVYRSVDGGLSWEQVLTGVEVTSLAINSEAEIFASTYDYVYRSTSDGTRWDRLGYNELPYEQIFALGINSKDDVFVGVAGFGGIFRSQDKGDTWIQSNNGLTNTMIDLIVFDDNDVVYIDTGDGLFTSADNGDNWVEFDKSGLTCPNFSALCFPAGGGLFASSWCMDEQVFVYQGSKATWELENDGLPASRINCLKITSDGRIFAGTADRGVFVTSGATY